MIHKIKIEKPYADAVLIGDKTFEVRYDDRGYQKGDVLKFNVIDNDNHEINHPLNDKDFEITYVLHGWGLKDSWCVFSIEERAQGERAEKALSIIDRLYTEGHISNTEQGVLRRAILFPQKPQGKWIEPFERNGKTYHKCNKCHISSELTLFDNYCPFCGAEMLNGGTE